MDFSTYAINYKFQDEKRMKPSLPALANYREWTHRTTSGNMIYEYSLFPIVCGGVSMDMTVNESSFSNRGSDQLSSFRTAALRARPSKDALTWVVPIVK